MTTATKCVWRRGDQSGPVVRLLRHMYYWEAVSLKESGPLSCFKHSEKLNNTSAVAVGFGMRPCIIPVRACGMCCAALHVNRRLNRIFNRARRSTSASRRAPRVPPFRPGNGTPSSLGTLGGVGAPHRGRLVDGQDGHWSGAVQVVSMMMSSGLLWAADDELCGWTRGGTRYETRLLAAH